MKTRASSFSVLSTDKRPHSHATSAFTIVELLIVIVVIAILAAITIVAYNGVQQRANNTAIIDAASKSLRMIQSYIAVNGSYPYNGGGNPCVTSSTGCAITSGVVYGANSTFDTNMATIGSLPKGVPSTGTASYGIMYNYISTRTFNGDVQPAIIFYWLFGTSQQCGLTGVIGPSWLAGTSSATGYTSANDGGGKTLCYVYVPGPSA